MAPRLGIEEIDRKYEVLEKMREGGMGALYKVRHRLLDEVRVIKMIRAQFKEEREHQARFLREAQMASRLRHPGIAQLYDFGVGEEDDSAYMVIEFIEGTDLSQLLAGGKRLDPPTVLAIADQTLSILGYLHGERFVHRDISPDNIMLMSGDGPPTVKLIDLGIAKPLEASQQFTRTGMFVGKLKYASPEQLGSEESQGITARSDLYSFGVVLYQALTGAFPITGDSEAAILAGHLIHPPKSFEETDPDGSVSPGLRSVVLRALEKTPERRWQSADEFRRALAEAAGGGAVPAAPAPPGAAAGAAPAPGAGARPVEATVSTRRPRRAGDGERSAAALGATLRRAAAALARPRVGLAVALVAVLGGGVALWRAVGAGDPGAAAPPAAPRPGPPPGAPPPAAGLAALDFGSYHALVIGNDRYRQLPALKSAVADARKVAELLEERYGFNVRLLTDATRHEIISGLTEVTDGLSARDNLLLFYAGHGWLDDQSQSGYWQPVDAEPFNTANWISTRHEISAVLDRTPARQVLVVADSCYAGSMAEVGAAPPGPPLPPGPDHVARVRELLGRRARLALTSGGLSPVLDQGEGRHSVFSKALLEVLGANSRIVEVSHLFGDLETRVTRAAARYGVDQRPQLAAIAQAGDEGGEFFFVPARAAGRS